MRCRPEPADTAGICGALAGGVVVRGRRTRQSRAIIDRLDVSVDKLLETGDGITRLASWRQSRSDDRSRSPRSDSTVP